MAKPKLTAPAPHALLAAPAAAPAGAPPASKPGSNVAALPKVGPHGWHDRIVALRSKIEAVRHRDDEAATAAEIAELSVVSGVDGALELVEQCRQQRQYVAIELESLSGALARAEKELAKAEHEHRQREIDRRIGEAKQLALRIVRSSKGIGALLDQLNAAAADYIGLVNGLSAYRDLPELTKDRATPVNLPAAHRLRSREFVARSIWKAGEALGNFLDLQHVGPTERTRTFSENVASAFGWLLSGTEIDAALATPANPTAPGAVELPAEPAQDDATLGQFGGIVLTSLTTGGKSYMAGERLPPELCLSWKQANRCALVGAGRVEFFKEPQGDSSAALLG